MTGSLQTKKGKYYAVLNLKDKKGNRKQKWICTGFTIAGNKRKAQDFLNRLLIEYERKEHIPENEHVKFSDFICWWLEDKKGKVETSTWEKYKICVEKHVAPYFEEKGLTLAELSPKHFVEFYNEKFVSGRLDGKPGGLSVASLKGLSLVIKEALNTAVMMEYINRNPALNVPLPRGEEKRQANIFLNAEQANMVLRAFRGHPMQPLIYITLYYGLRRSEVLGLRWSAIDFEKNTLTINHTVVKNLTVVAKDRTKTAASNRTYDLLPEVKEILLQLKKEREERKRLFARSYIDTDYVFVWPNGKPYAPDYITRVFQRVLKKNHLPKMRFHDLRHSTASILYDKGWDLKDIQEWLRHADIETTGNIYTHISQLRRHSMAKDIENTFKL